MVGPLPDRLTSSPSFTVWSVPAFADQFRLAASTITCIVSVVPSEPPLTRSENSSVTSVVRPEGAVKLGVAVVVPLSVTVGSPVWIQRKVTGSPSGSWPLPDRFTVSPSLTV